MKRASATKIAAQFDDFLEASREHPVLVTRKGKPVAVLVGVNNQAEAEQLTVGRLRSLRSVFQDAHEQLQQEGGIPHAQFWREVEQARSANRPPRARRKRA
ncbi:MAG: type II toxin-antitoxin system prevent-host-death family antitoxin [Candidatus Binatia bacterium]